MRARAGANDGVARTRGAGGSGGRRRVRLSLKSRTRDGCIAHEMISLNSPRLWIIVNRSRAPARVSFRRLVRCRWINDGHRRAAHLFPAGLLTRLSYWTFARFLLSSCFLPRYSPYSQILPDVGLIEPRSLEVKDKLNMYLAGGAGLIYLAKRIKDNTAWATRESNGSCFLSFCLPSHSLLLSIDREK